MACLSELIKFYFMLGLRHGEILLSLSSWDSIVISMQTLRRNLKRMWLYWRKNESEPIEVARFLFDQLEGHGRLHGYKLHQLNCIYIGYVVTQITIWLQAYSTNNDPKVIAGYFIAEVEKKMGTPARIRSDLGHNGRDADSCIGLWIETVLLLAFLRRHHGQHWINRFQELKDNDCFSGCFLDKQLILFTCLNIIEVAREAVDACKQECQQKGPYTCDGTVFSLCCLIMSENFLLPPSTAHESIELYLFLRAYILKEL
ncbi:E3 ubiquitin-protein ligase [Sarotherodon galilaeus]